MTRPPRRTDYVDDGLPINTCPGCLQDITAWRSHVAHYRLPEAEVPAYKVDQRELPWPFVSPQASAHPAPVCAWDRDYLVARQMSRMIVAGEL